MGSRYSAAHSQGVGFKPCGECGVDISSRHYIAVYCLDCAYERSRRSQKAAKREPRLCIRCGKNETLCRQGFTCRECSSARYLRHKAVGDLTRRAVALGLLRDPKTLSCEDCGIQAECYDHRDYNEPLKVAAVCLRCNSRRGAGIPRSTPLYTPASSSAGTAPAERG